MVVVKGDICHRIVATGERPEAEAGNCRRRRDQGIGNLEPMRSRIPGEVCARPPSDRSIEHDLAPRVEEGFGDRFLAGAHARPNLGERHRATVGRHTLSLEDADRLADLSPAAQNLDDDVRVDEDTG